MSQYSDNWAHGSALIVAFAALRGGLQQHRHVSGDCSVPEATMTIGVDNHIGEIIARFGMACVDSPHIVVLASVLAIWERGRIILGVVVTG
eukprot:gene10579-biopygen8045